jgi:cytochrome P450
MDDVIDNRRETDPRPGGMPLGSPGSMAASPSFPPGPPLRKGAGAHARHYLRFFRDPLGFVARRFDEYGDVYYAPSDDGGLYVVKHPDHLREVLVTRAASFHKTHSAFLRMSRFLGDGLLTTDGETWRRQRRMVNPAFAQARLAGYAEVMSDEASRAVARWRDGEVRDMSRAMMELTLRVVSRTLLGQDVGAHVDEVGRAMVTFQESMLSFDRFLPTWVPTPHRRDFRRALRSLDAMMYGTIDRRRRDIASAATERRDLLDMLVRAKDEEGDGGRLSEREIRDQLVTLFLAGHETTSHALTWTLYLLSQNPAAESALHAEIDGVLGGRSPTFDDLARLPYTEQVLSEAMRLYPPVFTIARKAHEDTEIGGYAVRAGSEAVLWVYMTHRDPRWYADPEAFRPERFAEGAVATRPKLAYLPFGSGPRACIGKVFAMIEARLLLATIAQRFRLQLAPGQRVTPRPRITLVPEHGMKMALFTRARPHSGLRLA